MIKMRKLSGLSKDVVKGDAIVEADHELEFLGVVVGNLIVGSSSKLIHYGVITNNLIVKEDGQAIVHGMICRKIISEGGLTITDGIVLKGFNKKGGKIIVKTPEVIEKALSTTK